MLNFSEHWENWHQWCSTPLGQAFLKSEGEEIKKTITTLFGYHFLLLGEESLIQSLLESPIIHRVWLDTKITLREDCSPLCSRYDKLPIISDGIDVVYLAHCLEFISNPHEVLRETFRILIPEGHVMITGFNPWSLWGIWRFVLRLFKRAPWDGRFISISRMKDWLALLGFDVIQINCYFFNPPFKNLNLLSRLKWLEKLGGYCWPLFGGGYLLLARKRVIALTPIKPAFKTESKLAVQGIIEPVRAE